MRTIARYLDREHRLCDEQFELAEANVNSGNWEQADRQFSYFLDLFHRHLAKEEQVLFPRLERALGNAYGPTLVMRSEHNHMRHLLAQMQTALNRRSSAEFYDHSDMLRLLMQQHNQKEERILYPQAEQLLEADADAILISMDAMQDVAEGAELLSRQPA